MIAIVPLSPPLIVAVPVIHPGAVITYPDGFIAGALIALAIGGGWLFWLVTRG